MEYIRLAKKEDSKEILEIYKPYITKSAISFEYDVPGEDEFLNRIENIIDIYPYLVYIINDKIVAYAYASQHRSRFAYNWSVDVSIYIKPEYFKKGLSYKLYNCLFELLKLQGFYTVFASINSDNERSINFHKKYGFKFIGTYHNVGYKFDKWHDVSWYEKNINDYSIKPKKIINITQIDKKIIDNIFDNKNLQVF